MRTTSSSSNSPALDPVRPGLLAIGAALLVISLVSGAARAGTKPVPEPTVNPPAPAAQSETKPSGEADSSAAAKADVADTCGPESQAAEIAQRWGVEVTSIRLTASDHMIDYRYRVLDEAKASDLFERQIKPRLIHQKTGKVLGVPSTAKLGPLRNSNPPHAGKIYWMFFGNAGYLVKAGDKVTVEIGDFRVENLVVE